MSDSVSGMDLFLVLVVGPVLGWFGGMAMIHLERYVEGRRAKLQAYAEMERRFHV